MFDNAVTGNSARPTPSMPTQGQDIKVADKDWSQELCELVKAKACAVDEHRKVYAEFRDKREQLRAIQGNIENVEKEIAKVAPKFEDQNRIEFI